MKSLCMMLRGQGVDCVIMSMYMQRTSWHGEGERGVINYVAINNLLEKDCLQIAAPLTDDFGLAFMINCKSGLEACFSCKRKLNILLI